MSNKRLLFVIRSTIILAFVVATYLLAVVVAIIRSRNFEYDHNELISILLWATIIFTCALPCYYALTIGWRLAGRMEKNLIFSSKTVSLVKQLYVLALVDSVFLALMTVITIFLNRIHPSIFLISVVTVGLGIIFALVFYVVYHYLNQAVRLKEESELTI